MSCTYIVLRGALFHFRIRVPNDLVSALGRRELRMSLGEARQRQAVLKATQLVLHAQSFFSTVRRFMKHLTPEQIAQLVAAWRDRMNQRDTQIRRQIEVGLHSQSLDGYASHCSAHADVFERLLEELTLPPAVHNDEAHRPLPTRQEREAAYRSAAEAMTIPDDPESDLVALIDSGSLKELDEVSQRDLAKHYLAAGVRIYTERGNACHSLSVTIPERSPIAPPIASAPKPIASAPSAGERLSEAWEAYKENRVRRAPGWKENVPEKAVLAFKDFIELIGDKQLRDVNRADCTRFRDFQEVRPRGSISRYRGVSAASLEADLPGSFRTD